MYDQSWTQRFKLIMSYIKTNLDTGEKIIWDSRVSIKALILSFTIFLIIGFVVSYLGFYLVLETLLPVFFKINIGKTSAIILTDLIIIIMFSLTHIFVYYSSEFAVTNKRVISKTGIISRDVSEMNLNSIEGVNLEQNILGRLLNFGVIKISGRGNSTVVFQGIDDPIKVRKLVQNKS